MALDVNMDYYTIRLDPDASKICISVYPCGKHAQLWLSMGVAGSRLTFPSKMSELMETLEFVRMYIDDLVCITKGTLEDHRYKLP